MTPDQLLAAYLNVAFFSHSAYGIEVASEVYFSKHASQLTLPEAALLAGLVQSPSQLRPGGRTRPTRCSGGPEVLDADVAAALHL